MTNTKAHNSDSENASAEILKELKKLNQQMNRDSKFRKRFLMSVVGGFGSVIGATVVVSIVILALNQLVNIDLIEPVVQRVLEIVEQKD